MNPSAAALSALDQDQEHHLISEGEDESSKSPILAINRASELEKDIISLSGEDASELILQTHETEVSQHKTEASLEARNRRRDSSNDNFKSETKAGDVKSIICLNQQFRRMNTDRVRR